MALALGQLLRRQDRLLGSGREALGAHRSTSIDLERTARSPSAADKRLVRGR
jgi:hypothetical protein